MLVCVETRDTQHKRVDVGSCWQIRLATSYRLLSFNGSVLKVVELIKLRKVALTNASSIHGVWNEPYRVLTAQMCHVCLFNWLHTTLKIRARAERKGRQTAILISVYLHGSRSNWNLLFQFLYLNGPSNYNTFQFRFLEIF